MKLRTIALQSKLRLTTLATKLRVVAGEFISAVLALDSTSVLDSAAKRIGKNRTENLSVADRAVRVPNKRVADATGASDGGGGLYFAEDYVVGAPSAQTYTLVGGFSWALYKAKQESLGITDSIGGKYIGKNLSESVVVAERISGVSPLDESVNESPAVVDSRVSRINKPITDAPGAADSKVLQFGKRISEVSLVTDARVSALYRAIGDTAGVTDGVPYRSVLKVVTEAPAVSSSGSLRSQGYTVDMSYFAEDYVGSSRAFS